MHSNEIDVEIIRVYIRSPLHLFLPIDHAEGSHTRNRSKLATDI